MRARTVVIGIGNPMRGDDGAGVAVAERLRARVPPSVEVVSCALEPSRLIDAWQGADSVVLVDSVASGATPGTLHRFDAGSDAVPARVFRSSTHAIGIAETIELARALGRLPRRARVYGVEAASFVPGAPLSPAADAGADAAVDAILRDLEEE